MEWKLVAQIDEWRWKTDGNFETDGTVKFITEWEIHFSKVLSGIGKACTSVDTLSHMTA